jgi:adenylate cyclase
MNLSTGIASFFVADWLVDPKSNSLIRGAESRRVEPKAMRVLILLAVNAGQVVTRQELEDEIWADMVVGPDSLTNTVIKLRRALGDDARNARIIETIPKTGYRLIALVREAEDGESEPSLERRLSAILYADVAEYSRLTGEDEERTHRILSANLDLFSESIRTHNGKVVHYAGDAILAEFTTVTEALSCAVEVQLELHEVATARPDNSSVQFRIGINLGEVIVDRDDIYGEGVNIAARLEGLADTGGICISESVYSAVGNKLPLEYEFMGEQSVKNIAEPVRAYRVLFHSGSRTARQKSGSPKKFLLPTAVVAAAIIGLVFLWPQFSTYFDGKSGAPETISLDKPTIAVLPFANVSVDVNEDYLAVGMTRDIITDLTKISGIYVIAYSSVRPYENQAINVAEIGHALGAQYIVEGSIRRAGDRVRINVQLVEAESGRHRWAERYDRDFDEFFALQDEVISQVVSEISVSLTASESAQIERLPTTNLEAYDYYLRAEQAGYIDGGTGLIDTMTYYEKAISLDPEFAEAHAGLARAAVAAWRSDIQQVIPGAKARAVAYEAASKALEIDPANGQAYSVLAVLQLADGRHEAAIESARKAVELGPGSAQAHLDLGLVLAYSGKSKLGVTEIETVLRLNPKPTPDTHFYAGIVLFIDGQYQRAVDSFSKARAGLQGSDSIWGFLAAAHGLLGQKEEAANAVTILLENYPNLSIEYYRARNFYFRRPEDLDRYLQGMRLAGLPAWSFNFQGQESDRLKGAELSKLVEDKTWAGKHSNGTEFYQQVTSSGALAYRSENSFQTGTATIEGDKLCQRFDTTLNRKMCGYVYYNPDRTSNSEDQYIVVMPDSLRYFSVTP